MTAEDFETEVVMSCLPKEGGTVMREDLCFVNFAKRPRKDPPAGSAAGVLLKDNEQSRVLKGYEAFAEPRVVARWLQRVLSQLG
mmetsp:Transcript_42019/g.131646  ORF Transcript_42019/g.131646 Transcript_42019/m.131646 type:complete len:84 (-) Transcript_42019:254-505(-)